MAGARKGGALPHQLRGVVIPIGRGRSTHLRRLFIAAIAASLLVPLVSAAAATAAPTNRNSSDRAPYPTKGDGPKGSATSVFSGDAGDAQHGTTAGHLPGSSSNVELVEPVPAPEWNDR